MYVCAATLAEPEDVPEDGDERAIVDVLFVLETSLTDPPDVAPEAKPDTVTCAVPGVVEVSLVTATVAAPVSVPATARTVADPTVSAETTPLSLTATTLGADVDQVIVTPDIFFPWLSVTVAASFVLCPTVSVTDVGEMLTLAILVPLVVFPCA